MDVDAPQSVQDLIREAFPASAYFGVATACSCEECREIASSLLQKSWDQVPNEVIDLACNPVLLTAEAFAVFLPAWMMRALAKLDESHSVLVEFTVYSLSPLNADDTEGLRQIQKLQQIASIMTAQQRRVVRRFLKTVEESPASKYLRDYIESACRLIWTNSAVT